MPKEPTRMGSKGRVTGVNVFLLEQFSEGLKIPKNGSRAKLKQERNKIVYINRNDDPARVEEKIKSAFGLPGKFTILESDHKGCNLHVSPMKSLSGYQAIQRRKALYLCEVSMSKVHMHILTCIALHMHKNAIREITT